MAEGKFGTAINCMDGRVQEPVINWMKVRYGLDYVDMITEPGPIKLVADQDPVAMESILKRLSISINKHHSGIVAVVGHHDCAGNPVPRDAQVEHIKKSIEVLQPVLRDVKIIGLYVSDTWLVSLVAE
jgi:hypothetical protein